LEMRWLGPGWGIQNRLVKSVSHMPVEEIDNIYIFLYNKIS
jgi:hypothetical protein